MKIDFNFWKKNTYIHPGNLFALIITGCSQIIVLHLLIGYPSVTQASLIARGVILIVMPFLAGFFASRLAVRSTGKLQIKLFRNLARTPTNDLEQLHAHTFVKAATQDVDYMYHFWREFFANVCFNLPVMIYLLLLLLIQSSFFVVAGSFVALSALVATAYRVVRGIRKMQVDHHVTNITLQDKIRNYVENAFQFRLYGSEKDYLNVLQDHLTHFGKLTARLSQFRQLYSTYVSTILLLFLWGALWLMQHNGSMTSTEVAVLTLVFLEIRRIGNEVFGNINSFQRARESAKTLVPWLTTEIEENQEDQHPRSFLPLRINNLKFVYKDSKKPIRYPDFEILPGEKVWIKGRNGRGKSTLWKILTGLYTDSDTTLWLNDNLEKGNGLTPFWKNAAAVTEPAKCYNGMIWEIIGNFSVSREEVTAWLTANQLLSLFDEYPAKLETFYDSAVNNLSAGQLKWILIVQSFYLSPDLLILDEPFSSLDVERKQITLNLISQLPKSVTLLVITHQDIAIHFDKTIIL